MKNIWKQVVEWVAWRRRLPLKFRAAQELMLLEQQRLKARCEKVEAGMRAELERERAFSKAVGMQLLEVREELRAAWAEARASEAKCDALRDGQTLSGLSPAEVERLALLVMAAGKLSAEAAKVVLYGWGSPSPCTGRPAYVDVERGMGRLAAAAELMAEAGDVREGDVRAYGVRAKERMAEQATRQGAANS